MNGKLKYILLPLIILGAFTNQPKKVATHENKANNNALYDKGQYGYDFQFLKQKLDIIELVAGNSRLLVVPEYQGRVMSSTSSGMKGYSHGWVNYDLIASKKVNEDFNAYGGSERIWLGPEAGRFSIYFKSGDTNFKHWVVPAVLDREPFEVAYSDSSTATVVKNIELKNYSGTTFKARIERTVKILHRNSIDSLLGLNLDKSIGVVGYQSENNLINTGSGGWDKKNGALSIWMLSMLKASPYTTVVLPYKKRGNGKIVSTYFGDIPDDRMKVTDDAIFFLADGEFRSKAGMSPGRVLPYMGAYDSKNRALTIIKFIIPEDTSSYVNSRFDSSEDPFQGDVVNFFNSSPAENNTQPGQYFELELSSPAAFLKPSEQITHTQWVYHFTGDEKHLDKLTKQLLKAPIEEIKSVFKKNNDQ